MGIDLHCSFWKFAVFVQGFVYVIGCEDLPCLVGCELLLVLERCMQSLNTHSLCRDIQIRYSGIYALCWTTDFVNGDSRPPWGSQCSCACRGLPFGSTSSPTTIFISHRACLLCHQLTRPAIFRQLPALPSQPKIPQRFNIRTIHRDAVSEVNNVTVFDVSR